MWMSCQPASAQVVPWKVRLMGWTQMRVCVKLLSTWPQCRRPRSRLGASPRPRLVRRVGAQPRRARTPRQRAIPRRRTAAQPARANAHRQTILPTAAKGSSQSRNTARIPSYDHPFGPSRTTKTASHPIRRVSQLGERSFDPFAEQPQAAQEPTPAEQNNASKSIARPF